MELYHELVSPEVQPDDLIAHRDIVTPDRRRDDPQGADNIYNKWNTALGIAHLGAPPNSLAAEIQLGGDATVLYASGHRQPPGRSRPADLLLALRRSRPQQRSDHRCHRQRAGAAGRQDHAGRNPVGLYMDHIDLAGWWLPHAASHRTTACAWVRGDAQQRMIERLVVEVPRETGYTISDLTIAGEPIRYGGQIAECITVKLVGVGAPLAGVKNAPVGAAAGAASTRRPCARSTARWEADPTPKDTSTRSPARASAARPRGRRPVAQVATGAPQPVAHHQRQPSMRGAR